MAHKEKTDIEKVRDLIKGIRIAMLTTMDEDGSLRSRPMATQKTEFDGEVWFFTEAGSAKTGEIAKDRRVNVSYADPDSQHYVSLSGTAQTLIDTAKAKELWSPAVKAWFPDGPDDPKLALLRVRVEKAEYWDSPSAKMVQLAGFVKALVTGERLDYAGEHEKLDLEEAPVRR
jgi:general stress protein 26